MERDLHAGFQSSATSRPERLFAFLDKAAAAADIRSVRERMLSLVDPRPGQSILDVGCGVGHELRRLADEVAPGGRVLGIDKNVQMVEEARRRTADLSAVVDCRIGDAQQLEGGPFDACRAERVLMYLPDPKKAIEEMVRVTKPGGVVVLFELDYGATLIDSSDRGLARKVLDLMMDSLPNPWMGRQLRRHLAEAGLKAIEAQSHPVQVPGEVYREIVGNTLLQAVERNQLTKSEYEAWASEAGDPKHYASFIGVLAAGRK